ncbi:hypothetical protein O181_024161 [Austropuccinia psidii MF-1]|uniref:RNase H type-1 domain-containing protein n=1 Tax=Austropuccinia psidii MF-1 TaxID=1389203 RepID=A0A9Q3CKV4_9BASI|nr:hypothetical protein [Austropuccinia psidii MF-1]
MALLLFQELIQDHITRQNHPAPVALFSDNQAAPSGAMLPKKKTEAQNLQLKLFTNLQQCVKNFLLHLYRCPGHGGIPENKSIDTLAKNSSE